MELYDYFENYLSDKLSKEEKMNFEKRLEVDEAFRLDFISHKDLQGAFDVLVEEDVMKHINTIKTPETQPHTITEDKKPSTFWKKFLIGLIIGFFAMSAIMLLGKQKSKESIYMAEYQAPLNNDSVRSGDSTNTTSQYFQETKHAHELVAAKKYKDAAAVLEPQLKQFSGTNRMEIEWYLALIYSNYDLERSRALLFEISSDPGHPYSRKAKRLLVK